MTRTALAVVPSCPLSALLGALLLLGLPVGCGPEKPPQAGDAPPREQAAPAGDAAPAAGDAAPAGEGQTADGRFDPTQGQFVLTYAGDRGEFSDCTALDEVPEAARGLVGVNLFGERAPAGKVWLCNLSKPDAEGLYALEAVPRERFEEIVLGDGRSSDFALPGDLELPELDPAKDGPIILYKTDWCGVCKQAEAYMKRKGIEYVAKDIEKDQAAGAELAAKAKAAGVPMGSVPMIDVHGELLRGFDRNRLEELI